jgi:hypothetical protein
LSLIGRRAALAGQIYSRGRFAVFHFINSGKVSLVRSSSSRARAKSWRRRRLKRRRKVTTNVFLLATYLTITNSPHLPVYLLVSAPHLILFLSAAAPPCRRDKDVLPLAADKSNKTVPQKGFIHVHCAPTRAYSLTYIPHGPPNNQTPGFPQTVQSRYAHPHPHSPFQPH